MNTIELTEAIAGQTAQLEKILLSGIERAQRQEDILVVITKVNGYVRTHGELLAAHQQWMESHDKAHSAREKDYRTLTNRVWALAGIDAGLATEAILLQFSPLV